MNAKIITSLLAIVAVGAVAVGGTYAWFNSQQSSTGNTFSSGSVALKLANVNSADWANTVAATWAFTNMAPGGAPQESTLRLENQGTVKTESMDLSLAGANDSGSGIEKQLRITKLTIDGLNMLKGGAGADFSNYAKPLACSTTVTSGAIQAAIDAATAPAVICVGAGTYTETLNINKKVTVVALNAPNSANKAKLVGTIGISADGATVKGLDIEPSPVPSQGSGITVSANTVTIDSNIINGISSTVAGSIKGIYAGDSTGTGNRTGLVITNNSITNVTEGFGKGAYGILLNYGASLTANGAVVSPVISHNTISGINGGWAHAIGLETDTPGAQIILNDIHDVISAGTDRVGVYLEDNNTSGTVVINQNNFTPNVSFGVATALTEVGAVNAQNNWWGDNNPADQILSLGTSGPINTATPAGNAFVGLVNGVDGTDGNGYADLQDLRLNPIVGFPFELVPNVEKQLVMGVQLDGPTTDNSFEGKTLTTDVVVNIK